jgi:hypothetical protein
VIPENEHCCSVRNKLLTEELHDGYRPKTYIFHIKKSFNRLSIPAGCKVCKNKWVGHNEI